MLTINNAVETLVQTSSKWTALVGGLLWVVGVGHALAEEPAPGDPGIWQKHQYSFAFMGFTSTYSCDGLADKLKLLLLASGARADLKATPGACAEGFGRPDKLARADLTFYTLVPVNGSAKSPMAGVATAPVNGSAKSPAQGVATAPASGGATTDGGKAMGNWRPVVFAARTPRDLGIGDCELVEQFESSVLPLFTTRNVDSKTRCVPHQDSGSTIDLKFEAFAALPQKHIPAPVQGTQSGI